MIPLRIRSYKDNRPDGKWIEYYPNSIEMEIIIYQNGEKIKKIEKEPNGDYVEEEFHENIYHHKICKNNIIIKHTITEHRDEQIVTWDIDNQKKTLRCKEYYELHPILEYGRRKIVEEYDIEGKIIKKSSYFNNNPDGIWIEYLPTEEHHTYYNYGMSTGKEIIKKRL